MAVDQIQIGCLTHCYRGQAPSHIWIVVGQLWRRTQTLTSTVAAINHATAATASEASSRRRSTIT